MTKLWQTFKILLTGQFKSAWWFFTFVGQEKLDIKQEDFEYDDKENSNT